jgi:hypothetical protein
LCRKASCAKFLSIKFVNIKWSAVS